MSSAMDEKPLNYFSLASKETFPKFCHKFKSRLRFNLFLYLWSGTTCLYLWVVYKACPQNTAQAHLYPTLRSNQWFHDWLPTVMSHAHTHSIHRNVWYRRIIFYLRNGMWSCISVETSIKMDGESVTAVQVFRPWKNFPNYRPFVRGIHRYHHRKNSARKGQ